MTMRSAPFSPFHSPASDSESEFVLLLGFSWSVMLLFYHFKLSFFSCLLFVLLGGSLVCYKRFPSCHCYCFIILQVYAYLVLARVLLLWLPTNRPRPGHRCSHGKQPVRPASACVCH